MLEHVLAMPITTWKYKDEASGAKHMGPMAQDFYAAFELGDDDRHVTSIDESGAAFAAIQGLYAEVLRRDEAVSSLAKRLDSAERSNAQAIERAAFLEKLNAEADRRYSALEQRLAALEAQLGRPQR